MSWSRLLLLVVGIVLILGLTVWLLDALQRLYLSVAWISPLLGSVLLVLLLTLLVGLVVALVYYTLLFRRPQRRQPLPPQLPAEKSAVARETLKAVQRQVTYIQDEVARQALRQRAEEIEANLSERDLTVVVFGTGSAGKTSLINAIVGQVVGQVGAPMGTTTLGEIYTLRLRGLQRDIRLMDTPGIFEAGIQGTEHERLARQLAAEADLLLFVVDNDLRQTEYAAFQALAEIGKRSLLVFNKADLYLEDERQQIVARIQQRLRGLLSPDDVLSVSANPPSLQLESGEWVQPEPNILPLLRRMAAVLRAEGEDLVADNILLQSQRLSEEARQLIDYQRRQQAEKIVERFQWIGAGVVAATPLPVVDLLATAVINAQMVVEIGRVYGCEMNLNQGRELAISLAKTLVSLGVVRGALEIFSVALQTNVGTFLVGRGIQGVTAAYLTRIAGKSFIEYFRQNQDWGDGGITEVVQQQFQLNRRDEFMKDFVQEAVARVIRPLTESQRHSVEAGPEET